MRQLPPLLEDVTINEKFKTEVELAEVVCRWLTNNDWTVYKEVFTGDGDIDIVATYGSVVWAIECKLTLSHKLLEQGMLRRKHAHYVSLAVPERTARLDYVNRFFLAHHGLGLMEVTPPSEFFRRDEKVLLDGRVTEVQRPKILRNPHQLYPLLKRIKALKGSLREEHKELIAGSPGGSSLTPYKITVLRLREYLTQVGRATIKDIVNEVHHHYSTPSGARAGIAKAMLHFEKGFKQVKEGKTVYWELCDAEEEVVP